MKKLKILFCMIYIGIIAISISSCSSNSSTAENREVKTMDSVSTDLDKSAKELDAKTKKVEASLEKIDKEFNTTK